MTFIKINDKKWLDPSTGTVIEDDSPERVSLNKHQATLMTAAGDNVFFELHERTALLRWLGDNAVDVQAEPVKAAWTPKYEVGQRVKVVTKESHYTNACGKIIQVDKNDISQPYKVEIDEPEDQFIHEDREWFHELHLEPVTTEPAAPKHRLVNCPHVGRMTKVFQISETEPAIADHMKQYVDMTGEVTQAWLDENDNLRIDVLFEHEIMPKSFLWGDLLDVTGAKFMATHAAPEGVTVTLTAAQVRAIETVGAWFRNWQTATSEDCESGDGELQEYVYETIGFAVFGDVISKVASILPKAA